MARENGLAVKPLTLELDANKLIQNVEVTAILKNFDWMFKFRMVIGTRLLKLGAWIAGVKLSIYPITEAKIEHELECGCHYAEPYGWVVMAGCLEHDYSDDTLLKWRLGDHFGKLDLPDADECKQRVGVVKTAADWMQDGVYPARNKYCNCEYWVVDNG